MLRDVAFGFALGVALAVVGFPFITWQFWLLYGIAFAWRFTTKQVRECRHAG